MPRFIPRLLKFLEKSPPQSTPYVVPTQRPRPKVKVQKLPPECPPLSPEGRTQSIVLDSLNPILKIGKYARRKKLHPLVRVSKWRRKLPQTVGKVEQPRVMNAVDRSYWSNPYLRMLISPIRQCAATERFLPRDFLIPIKLKKIPGPRSAKDMAVAVPSNLEHPSFTPPPIGLTSYVSCWKDASSDISKAAKTFRMPFRVHSLFAQQVSHLLRVRVIQELHVLAERLEQNPTNALQASVIRRLTRAEWQEIKTSGTVPYDGAVAVLVVPPLNKNPTTGKRPDPSTFATPIEMEEHRPIRSPPRPLSEIYLKQASTACTADQEGALSIITPSKIPFYNGVSMFPSPQQRAALHASLLRALQVDRKARFEELRKQATQKKRKNATASSSSPKTEQEQNTRTPRAQGDQKGSHAFLISSNAASLLRADTVPLAIALWRVRMWEGAGWVESETAAGPWQLKEPFIDPDSS